MTWEELIRFLMPWIAGAMSLLLTCLLGLLAYLFSSVVTGMRELRIDFKTESKELREDLSQLTNALSELVREVGEVAIRTETDHEEIGKLRLVVHDHANKLTELSLMMERKNKAPSK
jgi:NTP pyrophosphatase (non-canonical NTP hydrolase)